MVIILHETNPETFRLTHIYTRLYIYNLNFTKYKVNFYMYSTNVQ